MRRCLQTRLSGVNRSLTHEWLSSEVNRRREKVLRSRERKDFNLHHEARSLRPLEACEDVWVLDISCAAIVHNKARRPCSYVIETPSEMVQPPSLPSDPVPCLPATPGQSSPTPDPQANALTRDSSDVSTFGTSTPQGDRVTHYGRQMAALFHTAALLLFSWERARDKGTLVQRSLDVRLSFTSPRLLSYGDRLVATTTARKPTTSIVGCGGSTRTTHTRAVQRLQRHDTAERACLPCIARKNNRGNACRWRYRRNRSKEPPRTPERSHSSDTMYRNDAPAMPRSSVVVPVVSNAATCTNVVLVTNYRQETQHHTKGAAVGHVEELRNSAKITVITEESPPPQ
ncbi:hypothetical protein HPB47_025139 [Ixodes persulcatus]|uniref:Uncharacterized protein n=1 Tax=Ixodes persulcatus TaxID=34615 RepID=A0AC60Q2C7_IXOPE|nr:hypothetical protein HPB47_025139 [Ixodes persulcatus]